MSRSTSNSTFPSNWRVEILPRRPLILPSRHFVYPAMVDEVERGALEVLVEPSMRGTDLREKPSTGTQPFLATCALGFQDPAVPTGVWSCPNPDWICAVSGGYSYLIDVTDPDRFTFLRYRPVLQVLQHSASSSQLPSDGLLLFVGHHSVLAWGKDGEAWESDRLSWEGITNLRI